MKKLVKKVKVLLPENAKKIKGGTTDVIIIETGTL